MIGVIKSKQPIASQENIGGTVRQRKELWEERWSHQTDAEESGWAGSTAMR